MFILAIVTARQIQMLTEHFNILKRKEIKHLQLQRNILPVAFHPAIPSAMKKLFIQASITTGWIIVKKGVAEISVEQCFFHRTTSTTVRCRGKNFSMKVQRYNWHIDAKIEVNGFLSAIQSFWCSSCRVVAVQNVGAYFTPASEQLF